MRSGEQKINRGDEASEDELYRFVSEGQSSQSCQFFTVSQDCIPTISRAHQARRAQTSPAGAQGRPEAQGRRKDENGTKRKGKNSATPPHHLLRRRRDCRGAEIGGVRGFRKEWIARQCGQRITTKSPKRGYQQESEGSRPRPDLVVWEGVGGKGGSENGTRGVRIGHRNQPLMTEDKELRVNPDASHDMPISIFPILCLLARTSAL